MPRLKPVEKPEAIDPHAPPYLWDGKVHARVLLRARMFAQVEGRVFWADTEANHEVQALAWRVALENDYFRTKQDAHPRIHQLIAAEIRRQFPVVTDPSDDGDRRVWLI